MKSKIETTPPQQAEIDWGKPMLVRNINTGLIVLVATDNDKEWFNGVTLTDGSTIDLGTYTRFHKSVFQPLPLPQTITFYE
jgi:hypothetical protein